MGIDHGQEENAMPSRQSNSFCQEWRSLRDKRHRRPYECLEAMRYTVRFSGEFKRSYKKCLKRGLDESKFRTVISILAESGQLPPQYRPHKLVGRYAGLWECHIQPVAKPAAPFVLVRRVALWEQGRNHWSKGALYTSLSTDNNCPRITLITRIYLSSEIITDTPGSCVAPLFEVKGGA